MNSQQSQNSTQPQTRRSDTLAGFLGQFLKSPEDRLLLSFNSHNCEERRMSVMVSAFDKDNNLIAQPFVMRGTYDEISNSQEGIWAQMGKYRKAVVDEANNLQELERTIKEAKKEKEKQVKEAKTFKAIQNRCVGMCNEETLASITSTPPSDDNFKTALERANLQTVLKALAVVSQKEKEKSRFRKLSTELKKIIGTTAEDMGIEYIAESDNEPDTTSKQPTLFTQEA